MTGSRTRLPLVTSLPPSLSRLGARGEEIGAEYQERCIESWHGAGLEPVSVNSTTEPYPHRMRMVPVNRDASTVTGRPNVFLADLLAVASEHGEGGPVVVMNADLLMRPGTELVAAVRELRPGEFMFSRRIEIERPDQTSGIPYLPGIDVFAGHAEDIARIPDGGMVFGASWWDYYLPLVMFAKGCRIHQTEPAVLHLVHRIQWLQAWEELGHRFIAEIQGQVSNEIFRSRLDHAIRGRSGHLLSDLRSSVRRRLPGRAEFEQRRALYRVAAVCRQFLDEVAQRRRLMRQQLS